MRVSWLTDSGGKIVGLLLQFRPKAQAPLAQLAGEPDRELWRICEVCGKREAVVLCVTHARFICEHCLPFHSKARSVLRQLHLREYSLVTDPWKETESCTYLSRSAAAAQGRT